MTPVVGHAYELKDPDYRFGIGTILVIITDVVNSIEYDRETWWRIRGRVAIGTAESHGGWQARDSLEVRGSSLRLARVVLTDTT